MTGGNENDDRSGMRDDEGDPIRHFMPVLQGFSAFSDAGFKVLKKTEKRTLRKASSLADRSPLTQSTLRVERSDEESKAVRKAKGFSKCF